MKEFLKRTIENIRVTVGHNKIVSGLSGGVDSSVLAMILKEAIGDQLTCIFIDTGLHREGLSDKINSIYREKLGLDVVMIDERKRVLPSLKGISESRSKKDALKKILNNIFLDAIFSVEDAVFLAHGTISEDTELLFDDRKISQTTHKGRSLQVIEPLRSLTKNQVIDVGRLLQIDDDVLNTYPLSAWGLARKIVGEATEERLSIVRKADDIYIQEFKSNSLYEELKNACATLLPINALANTDKDSRYGFTIILRALYRRSESPLNLDLLKIISDRIVNEVHGVTRVVFDTTSNELSFREWD